VYQVDGNDEVLDLLGLPEISDGAPQPLVIADEHRLVLAYVMQYLSPTSEHGVRGVGPSPTDQPIAMVTFSPCYAHMSGPPNDEAMSGHPLSSKGLSSNCVVEVKNSSWIRTLERMNSVHPLHRPIRYKTYRHVIFAFHDSTFECVCGGYKFETAWGSMESLTSHMMELLRSRAG
jgi:hypothetical protein